MREAFLVLQAEVAGLRAQTERQDYLIAELRHALYGKRSEQLDHDDRQLAFEDLETAVAEAEAARNALAAPNADGCGGFSWGGRLVSPALPAKVESQRTAWATCQWQVDRSDFPERKRREMGVGAIQSIGKFGSACPGGCAL